MHRWLKAYLPIRLVAAGGSGLTSGFDVPMLFACSNRWRFGIGRRLVPGDRSQRQGGEEALLGSVNGLAPNGATRAARGDAA